VAYRGSAKKVALNEWPVSGSRVVSLSVRVWALAGGLLYGWQDPQADIRRLLSATQYRPIIHQIDAPHLQANPLHRRLEALTDESLSFGGVTAIGQRF